MILFSCFLVLLTSIILYYLIILLKCKCYTNTLYLIIIETIILIFSISYILFSKFRKIKGGGEINTSFILLLLLHPIIIFTIIMNIITGFFIYNVYELSKNVGKDCKCSNEWIRYLLYFQAIIMVISLIIVNSIIINDFIIK